ncbi:unnamed protein product [Ectocarpus sp. CCAP 1310/34]|nr:unnamed protein product [Ectocarpus sp. CCAP 1310/34]
MHILICPSASPPCTPALLYAHTYCLRTRHVHHHHHLTILLASRGLLGARACVLLCLGRTCLVRRSCSEIDHVRDGAFSSIGCTIRRSGARARQDSGVCRRLAGPAGRWGSPILRRAKYQRQRRQP